MEWHLSGLCSGDLQSSCCSSACPTGVDTMANYEEVLHLIRYRNWRTAALFDRKFKLLCSELNGRYVSNEFQVEVGHCLGPGSLQHAAAGLG